MTVQDRYSVCEDWLVSDIRIDPQDMENHAKDKSVDHAYRAYICEAFEDSMRKSHFKFDEGNVYAFDGRVYRKSSPDVLTAVIGDVMKRKNFSSLYRVESCKPVMNHCASMLRRHCFRSDRNLISFSNCVYDISVNEHFPHSADLDVTSFLDFEYNPKAECPMWMKFLHEVVQSEEKIRRLQEFLGAAFLDRRKYKMEYMMFLVGTGQNGKGVFTNVISDLFGLNALADDDEKYEGMVSSFSPQELFTGNAEYKISAINGKLLNICEDMSNEDFSGGPFKKAVSGEPMPARDPYGKPFTATQIPLFIACLNQFPNRLKDQSKGNFRRYWVVEFNVTIPKNKVDAQLTYKLSAEKSGIFNWIVKGYKSVLANKGQLTDSKENDAYVRKLEIQTDSRLRYLSDKEYSPQLTLNAHRQAISMKDLYIDYCAYCKENNYNAFGKQEFGKKLVDEGYESSRRAEGMCYFIYQGPPVIDPDPPEVDESGRVIEYPEDDNDLPF